MNFESLAAFRLKSGPHPCPELGLCVMEAAAWLDGQPHSDQPKGVCPVLRDAAICVNDSAPSAEARQKLVPLIPRFLNTADPDSTAERKKVFDMQRQLFMNVLHRWDEAFAALEGLLDIGKQGGFDGDPEPRVEAYKAARKRVRMAEALDF